MVRKFSVALIMLMLFSVCAMFVTACDSSSGNETDKMEKVSLCDFESNQELLSIAYYNIDGKVELCSDSAYVTSGEYCAKVTTDIGVSQFDGADANFTFVTGTRFIPKTDYSDTVAFEMDFFNAYGKDVEVMLSVDSSSYLYYGTAKPGWNHFTMAVNRENLDLSSISTIDFWFRGKPKNTEEAYVFYVDNFVAVTTDNKVVAKTIDYSGKTPFRFDEEYEIFNLMQFMRTAGESAESRFANPRFSLNRDMNYILHGTGSMKVEFFSNSAGTGVVSVGFRMVRGMAEMSWNDYDYETTYLSCDVYNASDKDITFGIALYSQINEVYHVDSLIPAHSWSDPLGTRLRLQDMIDTIVGDELDIMTIVFYVSGFTETGDCLYMDDISFKSEEEFEEA